MMGPPPSLTRATLIGSMLQPGSFKAALRLLDLGRVQPEDRSQPPGSVGVE
jgi:hypothetical protein